MDKQFQYQHFDQEISVPEEQSQIKQITIEEALDKVGGQHAYQKKFFLFSGFVWLFGAASILSPKFEKSSFHCLPQIKNEECETWFLFLKKPESFIMSFSPPILCDRQYVADMQIAINYAGSALGFITSLYVADNIGRKFTALNFLDFSWSWSSYFFYF